MQRTGRKIPGPGVALEELKGEGELKHMALVYAPVFRDHPCLNGELEVGMGFMEQPQVTGLARLVRHDPGDGAFVYPTGTVWSVAELVRELADLGDVGGVKAGLELCYMVGEILVEAGDQATHSGLVGHGSIDPWKVLVKADGQVSLIGYGLPRPEIEVFVEDESRVPSEDGLRYCAPENLASERLHDLSSDLFSLCLVALELMMGRPVYDGLVGEIRKAASRGEAVRKLYQWRDRIPEAVRDVLGKALKPDPDIRFRDGLDFVYGVHDLLSGIDAGDGPSLREVVTTVRARQKRGRAVVGGNTGALTRAELAELAADIDQEGIGTDLPTPRRPRPADEAPEGAEQPRWRRASRRTSEPPEAPRAPAAPEPRGRERGAARGGGADDARERLLRRLRERDESAPRRRRPGATDEVPAPAPVSAGPPTAPPPSTPPPTAPAPTAPAPSSGRQPASPPARQPAGPPSDSPPPSAADSGPVTGRRRPGGRAAALLERLRSTSGSTVQEAPRPRTPRPVLPAEAGTERTAPRPAPERPSAPASPPAPESQPAPESAPPQAAPATPPPAREPEPATVRSPGPRARRQTAPTPDAPAAAAPAGSLPVRFGGRTVQIPREGNAAQVVALAVEALDLPLTDLLGARTASFHLVQDGRRVPAQTEASQLAPTTDADASDAVALELQRVPNQLLLARIEAPGDPALRVKTPVGTAVPVGQLKRSLRELLGIDGPFELAVGERALPADLVLAELDLDGAELVLKVTR